MRRILANLVAAALLVGVTVLWRQPVFHVLSYDAALAVHRPLAAATAAALGMSFPAIVGATYLWYGVWMGLPLFHDRARNWRAHVHFSWWSRVRRKWGQILGGARKGRSRTGFAHLQRLSVWSERQSWPIQFLVLQLIALAPAGSLLCIPIVARLNGRVQWPMQVLLFGTVNTIATLAWYPLMGAAVHAASGLQQVMIVGCQAAMGVMATVVVVLWLRSLVNQIREVAAVRRPGLTWRPAWSRLRA